jgi:Toastrack DUF4097
VRNAICLLPLLALASGPALAAPVEATRTLRGDHDVSAPFGVQNLAGRMRVVAGNEDRAEVTVTVHAESESLADAVRLQEVRDEHGVPTLRVRYPRDETQFRYPEGGSRNSRIEYDGRRVTVSSSSGAVVWADVEVRLPRRAVEAKFRNGVGSLAATGVSGTLAFDTASGDVSLSHVEGDLLADTGSGNVEVNDAAGRLRCDTGSGDCSITGFRGETLDLDTGSGSLVATDVEARLVKADTGSGDIRLSRAAIEELRADTGSGGVDVETSGEKLRRITADTGSGDVRLRMGPEASFEVRAELGGGRIDNRYENAEPILDRNEIVGYRRGDGRIKIDVDTGSGRLLLEP